LIKSKIFSKETEKKFDDRACKLTLFVAFYVSRQCMNLYTKPTSWAALVVLLVLNT